MNSKAKVSGQAYQHRRATIRHGNKTRSLFIIFPRGPTSSLFGLWLIFRGYNKTTNYFTFCDAHKLTTVSFLLDYTLGGLILNWDVGFFLASVATAVDGWPTPGKFNASSQLSQWDLSLRCGNQSGAMWRQATSQSPALKMKGGDWDVDVEPNASPLNDKQTMKARNI